MNRIPFALVLVLAVCVAATSGIAGTIRHDTDPQLYVDYGSQSQFDSVGQIVGTSSDFGYYASATLITPNWALTAGHVVDIATGLSFTVGGSTYSATSWVAHNKWDGDLGRGYDIGLIYFENGINGVSTATLHTGRNEVGLVGTAVGYGATGTGLTGDVTFDGVKRAGDNVIDATMRTGGKYDRVLLTDFDNPSSSADNVIGSATPLTLEYAIGGGDSGGGLFVQTSGGWELAGVNSFTWGYLDGNPDSDYGDLSGFTRVSAMNDWIQEIINGGGSDDGGGKGNGKGGGNDNGGGPPPGKGKNIDLGGTPVPEPGTLALLTLGGLGLAARLRRRR